MTIALRTSVYFRTVFGRGALSYPLLQRSVFGALGKLLSSLRLSIFQFAVHLVMVAKAFAAKEREIGKSAIGLALAQILSEFLSEDEAIVIAPKTMN